MSVRLFDQGFGGNAQLAVQPLNHGERQRTLAIQNLVHAIEPPDQRHEALGARSICSMRNLIASTGSGRSNR